MDEAFIRERITSLRMQKGVSEYQMSYDLGHSRGYINNISSGKALPSMGEFLAICDYFRITPQAFFDPGQENLLKMPPVLEKMSRLDADDLHIVEELLDRFLKK